MPVTIETTAYKFDELSDRAKDNARSWWWRESETMYPYMSGVIEDAERMASILGVEFDTETVQLVRGKTQSEPCVYWSGFSSQGDGACFEGTYRYAKGAAKLIREEAPTDTVLHRIADELQEAQKKAFYRLEASCSHHGHYYHSGCMSVNVVDKEYNYRNLPAGCEDVVIDALRSFADWIYRQLESEYKYAMSDENVDENIKINEYLFDENGHIV